MLSLRGGLRSLEARLGADIILVPSEAQSKVSFQNMFLQGTTGAFYMDGDVMNQALEVEGVEKVAPQTFLASLKADCCSVRIQVIGIDPEKDFTVQPCLRVEASHSLPRPRWQRGIHGACCYCSIFRSDGIPRGSAC